MQQRKSQRAFTLIEVIVVIVLMGIIAGMIVPRMGGSLQRQQAVQAAGEFAQTARTVSDLAVARQQRFAMQIDAEGYSVNMQSAKTGEYEAVRVSWLRPKRWPENVRVLGLRKADGTSVTGDSHRLEFRPDGSSSGVTLRIGSDQAASTVLVNAGNARTRVNTGNKPSIQQDDYDLGD